MAHALDRRKQPLVDAIEALRSTIYSLSEGVIVADKEGRFLLCNKTAKSILESGATNRSPQSWSEVHGCYKTDGVTPYLPEELPPARALAGETVSETEIFIRNEQYPYGIWISAGATPLRSNEGEIRGSVVTFRNVTTKKEAEARINTLTNAVEQTADGIIITDRGGLIEYINPAFETTTGYTFQELQGLTPRVLKSGVHDDSFYEKLWATILAGNVFRGTIANRKKSGEIFYAEQTITPMWGPMGNITHFVTVIKDVTELRKMQDQEMQMKLAREVQQQFYCIPMPKVDGFDFAGAAFPADATGGDYFDFLPLDDHCLGIMIGDVSGHGIGSALLMVELRAYLRAFAQKSSDLGEILSLTNNALVSDLEMDRYATLIFCRLCPENRTVVYSSAGHTPGFILDAGGALKRTLDSTDIPLGFLPKHSFGCSDLIQMDEGDILALLTDGITESERPDQNFFGMENARAFIRAHRHESAEEIVNGLYRAVRSFSDGLPQTDDITVVVCKVTGKNR
jgi:sigma-B regulation protein RsbU (phosphoserine phosphatase)